MEIKNLALPERHGLIKSHPGNAPELQCIHDSLDHISRLLEKELELKQAAIDKQTTEINRLTEVINARDAELRSLQEQLQRSQHQTEGSRQLVNKLLHDISHYQRDAEEYRKMLAKKGFWSIFRSKVRA